MRSGSTRERRRLRRDLGIRRITSKCLLTHGYVRRSDTGGRVRRKYMGAERAGFMSDALFSARCKQELRAAIFSIGTIDHRWLTARRWVYGACGTTRCATSSLKQTRVRRWSFKLPRSSGRTRTFRDRLRRSNVPPVYIVLTRTLTHALHTCNCESFCFFFFFFLVNVSLSIVQRRLGISGMALHVGNRRFFL